MLDTNSRSAIVDDMRAAERRDAPGQPRPLLGIGSIRHHGRIVWLTTGLFLMAGLLYAVARPDTYTASTLLLVYNRQISNTRDPVVLPGAADIPLVQNQIEMLRSRNVLTNVVETLGLDRTADGSGRASVLHRLLGKLGIAAGAAADTKAVERARLLESLRNHLSAQRVGASHAVLVSFKAADPHQAARIVNQVARSYLQETSRAWDVDPSKAPAIRERYQRLGPSAYVVSKAEPPIRPDGRPLSLVALGAGLAGLAVGVAAALLRDLLDNTVRSPDQVERALGLAYLGLIPRMGDATVRKGKPQGAAGGGAPLLPGSAARLLRTSAVRRIAAILQDGPLHGMRSLGVTSTTAGEGATTLAVGLAQALAAAGNRVLLIDAVPEDSSASRWAAADAGTAPASGSREPSPPRGAIGARNGVHVLPLAARSRPGSCSAGPDLLDAAVRAAVDSYDAVIVDLPSLVSGPDVRAATRVLDGFVLVVKWGETDADLIGQALESAGEAQARFIGAVLNAADQRTLAQYGCRTAAEIGAAPRSRLQRA